MLEILTDDQRDQLLSWMELYTMKTVIAMAAAPPPDGFGLKIPVTSLRRFYEGFRIMETRRQLEAAVTAAAKAEPGVTDRAAASAISNYVLHIATLPRIPGSDLGHITKWLLTLREQEIRAEKNKIARERLAQAAACEERKLEISKLSHGDAQPAPDPYKSEFLEMFRKSWERQEQQEQLETLVQI